MPRPELTQEALDIVVAVFDGAVIDAFVGEDAVAGDPAILSGRILGNPDRHFVCKAWRIMKGKYAWVATVVDHPRRWSLSDALSERDRERLRFANLDVNTEEGLKPARDLKPTPIEPTKSPESAQDLDAPAEPPDDEIPAEVLDELGGGWGE